MRVRSGVARRAVRVAVACAVGIAGVGLWAGPALAVECPSRAKECKDWSKVPGRGWMKGVVCPEYRSSTVTERVRNLTSNKLTLAVKNIDCYDWSNTGNPSQITGRVLEPGETEFYQLEQASTSRYDLGVFVHDGSGLRLGGKVNVSSEVIEGEKILANNLGETFDSRIRCRRVSLGEDPKRTRSSVPFTQSTPGLKIDDMTTIYSDGTYLYGVICQDRRDWPAPVR